MLARSGADVGAAEEHIAAIAGADAARRRQLMWRLSEAYFSAGYYALAAVALERLLGGGGDAEGADAKRGIEQRMVRADYLLRLGEPIRSAQVLIEAHRGLDACGPPCDGELVGRVEERMLKQGVFFHTVYHDSLDDRFYAGAEALYTRLLELPGRPHREASREQLANLRDARARASPADAKHGEQVLYQLAMLRADAVKSCYEGALVAQPDLVGTLRLRLEIDATGEVTGAASEPGEGLDGLPAVAACALAHARAWTFPTRGVPGKTTMALTYVLQPAAPEESR
jgi:hypothetical protein